MKILLGSHHFFPSTGGIETVSRLLAEEFREQGHEVRVITQTLGNGDFPFPVIRQPGAVELLRQIKWCDVFLQNNISLQTLWPLLLMRRPLCIAHQTWIRNEDGSVGWRHRLKRYVLRFAKSIAISEAIARRLPARAVIIGNPYDDHIFKNLRTATRTKELIFVGRLVSDKGVDLLLKALAGLPARPRLTIVGEGPERARLERQAAASGLRDQVDFIGAMAGAELAEVLNQHQILVVPSRWPEPFGIVALEGIACGCVVIGSAEGGLPEAIGPCGLTFPNGDAPTLAELLVNLLSDGEKLDSLRGKCASHLERFTRSAIAKRYLQILHELA